MYLRAAPVAPHRPPDAPSERGRDPGMRPLALALGVAAVAVAVARLALASMQASVQK